MPHSYDAKEKKDKHNCSSFRDGDWIIYTCPKCNYVCRENWRTGEYEVKNPNPAATHYGSYFPKEYADSFMNLN
jgi:hypothetical protein